MLGNYQDKIIPVTITSGNTVSDAVEVLGYNRIGIELPTFAVGLTDSTANVFVQVAATSTTSTLRRLVDMGVYSASSGLQQWEIPESTGNITVLFRPGAGFGKIAIEVSTAATAAGYQVLIHGLM